MRWPKDSSEEWLRNLTDSEVYGYASSAVAHSLALVLVFSVPQGFESVEDIEPISQPPRQVITLDTATEDVVPIEVVRIGMGELEHRAPGTTMSRSTHTQESDTDSWVHRAPTSRDGERTSVGGGGGSGKRFAMYCFGCDDCSANPSHPACWTSAIEVRNDAGVDSRGLRDWSQWNDTVHDILADCAFDPAPGLLVFSHKESSWSAEGGGAFSRCVIRQLEGGSGAVSPKSIRVWVGDEVEFEVRW